MNATPRPWTVQDNSAYPGGQIRVDSKTDGAVATCWHGGDTKLFDGTYLANAALIVRAVNSFDAMREALEQAIARIEVANREGNPIMSAWLPDARAALALAKGEQ